MVYEGCEGIGGCVVVDEVVVVVVVIVGCDVEGIGEVEIGGIE